MNVSVLNQHIARVMGWKSRRASDFAFAYGLNDLPTDEAIRIFDRYVELIGNGEKKQAAMAKAMSEVLDE